MPADPHEHHVAVERSARYYTLGNAHGDVKEVWFVLHGYGQLAGAFVRYFADLDDGSRIIVAPEALNRFYTVSVTSAPAADRPVGATWMTREDRERDIADYVAYLERVHAVVLGGLRHDPERVIALGFSQGAATVSRWVARGSARIDALVLWGGHVPPDLELVDQGAALRGVPLTIVAGSKDTFASGEPLAREAERLESAGLDYRLQTFEGGHAINRGALRELARGLTAIRGSGR